MRHPQAAERLAMCHDMLPQILEALGHPTTTPHVTRHEHGWVNVCFEVDETIIVRINARDPSLRKFEREACIYQDIAARARLPLPKLLMHDAHTWPYPVLVTTKLPGHNLAERWSTLAESQRGELARRAGSLLARLHTTRDLGPRGHGELFDSKEKRGPMSDAIQRRLASHVEEAITHEALEEGLARRLEAACHTILQRGEADTRAVLTHRDFHFGNLLHDGDTITGLLDFEWSMAADRLEDLVKWRRIAHLYDGANAPFLSGYASESGGEAVVDQGGLGAVYEAMEAIELAVVARRFYTAEEAGRYAERARGCLETLHRME